jgi:putative endonuclease
VDVTELASEKPPSVDPRRVLGDVGEQLAVDYLGSLGCKTIARNHRTRQGEIDLVALDRSTLAFIEVKTRRARCGRFGDQGFGWPAAAQRSRLRRLAVAWLAENRALGTSAHEIRFDAIRVLVSVDDELVELEYLRGAF